MSLVTERRISRRDLLKDLGLGVGLFYVASSGENPLGLEASKIAALNLFPHGIFPTEESQNIISDIQKRNNGSIPWRMISDNLYPVRERIFLFPSKHYYDMFFRDFEQASPFIKSERLDENILTTFENKQREDGQIPTAVAITWQAPYQYSDDETTLIYVISVARQKMAKPEIFTPQRKMRIKAALSFIGKHVENGLYVSPAGSRRGWVDAFRFPENDVITQNQGLYAVALKAAREILELEDVDKKAIDEAADQYHKLADSSGFLPLSRKFNQSPAIGGLYPDFVAGTMFGQHLLPRKIVSDTLELTPRSKHGYKVLTASQKGDYFHPSLFINASKEGRYQNGGVWPLWSSYALADGEICGVIDSGYRIRILKQLDDAGYAESIATGGVNEDRLTPEHLYYLWNLNIFIQHETLDSITGKETLLPRTRTTK